jgi:hypothetical protein
VTPTDPPLPSLAGRLFSFVERVAALSDVKAAVEANHDDNRWWPAAITDLRLRMAVAGWSTRVSYSMIDTYARVVANADRIGFDRLVTLSDDALGQLLQPLGLQGTRISYLRSLAVFLDKRDTGDLLDGDADELIRELADQVAFASFKVAQCAVLYARGYHCGVIPVDSGMVTKVAPLLGLELPSGAVAHERMRIALEACARHQAGEYRRLVARCGWAVTIPDHAAPSWWLHLVLIYFKRLYLNRADPRVCTHRPACSLVIDCGHRDP